MLLCIVCELYVVCKLSVFVFAGRKDTFPHNGNILSYQSENQNKTLIDLTLDFERDVHVDY